MEEKQYTFYSNSSSWVKNSCIMMEVESSSSEIIWLCQVEICLNLLLQQKLSVNIILNPNLPFFGSQNFHKSSIKLGAILLFHLNTNL